ncbi:mucin-5AC-like [Cimex lectularius]|uniref:CPR type cuticle protein n=1 Tax=Cimex lectularius TaxID=79782 RepID=A0A8I6RF76_CIMLE|nr:mucin-5AC-like [Cimex lectularius]XP_014243687.1 mucin-5AC-like [Cimex lectularius]
MRAVLLIVLLGVVRWSTAHVVYSKEQARVTRLPYDDWRPIREAPGLGRHVGHSGLIRYPLYQKGYSYSPTKKILAQQTDQAENIGIFSPTPPTILGSFSVFGHATVNAREHASHITKKSPRPQLTHDYHHLDNRPKLGGYPFHHQFVGSPYVYSDPPKRPQKYNDYVEQAYYYDSSLRPPPREINNKASAFPSHSQSTSLTPNTFYFEQPQPFQPSGLDNSFHKARKPNKPISHTPYRLGGQGQTLYPTLSHLDQFKTSVTSSFEPSSISFFNNGYTKNKNQPNDPYFHRNPFGDIQLSTRRPEQNIKPVTEEKEPSKDIYEHFSNLGRPFQSSQPYTTTVESQKDVHTYSPFVTTYPSLAPHSVKFSDVAQPFQLNDYQTQGSPLASVKPDYIVTQQPFTQDVYPITVTTIDVSSEPYEEPKKIPNETEAPFVPSSAPKPYSKPTTYETYTDRKPQVQINSYHGYNENAPVPFLPTPSPDVVPYLSEPTSEEQSTQTPEVSDDGQYNIISTIDTKYQENTELATESPTTTVAVETTTKYRPPKRRRPSRPSQTRNELTGNSKLKNHRLTDVSSTTVDYHKSQRRRKPSKYREGSEFKRQRTSTTTSTTPKPEIYEPTEQYDYTTAFSGESGPLTRNHNDNIITRPKEDEYNQYDQYYNTQHFGLGDVQIGENDQSDINYDDEFRHPPSSSTSTSTTTTTTTTTTTSAPITVTTPSIETATNSISSRLKNKYGNNRPRFSVKDYRERLNRATSTTTPTPQKSEPEIDPTVKTKTESTKYPGRTRTTHQPKPTSETSTTTTYQSESTTESKYRKYKSRIGPSRYKTSTTQQPENLETTTTERINTFRPSTNRYKPGTGKYYSRYRTSTIPPKEVDDSPIPTARVTIKPKGVFSAKRKPFPIKTKLTTNRFAEESSSEDDLPKSAIPSKIVENEVDHNANVISKKMDDGPTTTISAEEESSVKGSIASEPPSDPTGEEAMRIADLTSSSSNDYHSQRIFKGVTSANTRRTLPKITLPTDEPILPLEAFFQTHNKDKK